ncbi:MAG: PAS domain S-box protein [Melioribacteraceae bacterium]|nr:PAS domain S-box protein [Melioribacteraceae bacterium]
MKNEGYIEGIAVDITEQKQNEEKILRLSKIFEESLNEIYLFDVNTLKFIDVNEAALKNLGYTWREIANMSAVDIKPEFTFKQLNKSLDKLRKKEEDKIFFETLHQRKDKSKYYVEVHIQLIESSNLSYFTAIVIDITERKKAEAQLRESEERYKTLIESAPDAIAIHVENKIMFANRSSAKLLEAKNVDELVGMNIKKIVHPDTWESTSKRVEKILEVKKDFKLIEEKYVTLKGNVISVEVTAAKIIYFGKPAVQVISRDISERKKAQEQIVKERNRAERYFETAAVMMMVIDKEGRVERINEKGAEILGYSKSYIVGKKWVDYFLPKEVRPKVKTVMKNLMSGKVDSNEVVVNEVLCRYNKIKILGWHNNVVHDDDDNIIGILCSAEDITESVLLKEKLEETNKELSFLTRHVQDLREEERSELAREIHDDLGQALTAIKLDLSAIKNIEDDRLKLRRKTESAIDLTNQTIKTVQELTSQLRPGIIDDLGLLPAIEWYSNQFAERTGKDVRLSIKVEENDIEESSKITIYRIVQESLTNASRHSGASRVSLKLERKADDLVLSINDNGKGISKNALNKLTSFGLIGMRERAYSIGGEIKIAGKKDRGTTIKLVIPVSKEKNRKSNKN